jgi:O-antigen/teichoic acid export membrane protein
MRSDENAIDTPLAPERPGLSVLLLRLWRRSSADGVAWNVGVAILGVVLARLLGITTQIVLGRLMGLEDFGLYTTLYTLLGPVVILSSLGLDTWLLRQGGKIDRLDETISQVFSLRLLMMLPVMGLVVLGILAIGYDRLTVPLMVAAALGLMLELLVITANTALRAQVRNRAAAFLQVSVALLFIVLVLGGWNPAAPVETAVVYRLLAGLVGLGLLLWFLRRSLRIVWRPGQLWPMLTDARMYFVSDVLAQITMRADLMLVAVMLGTVAAGLYSPALTLINASFLVPSVAWQVMLPIIVRQKRDTSGLRWIIILGLAGNVIYGLVWVGAAFWGAEFIIGSLFGAEFMGVVPLLQVMSLVPLMKSFNFCSTTWMVAYDAQGLRTKIQAVVALAGLLIYLAAIMLAGLIGVAVANLVVEGLLLIGYGWGAWSTMQRQGAVSAPVQADGA